MPKVSIVLPNYNHQKYLEQRLNSILDQSFKDFEVIILDDASSDDSVKIIQEFVDDKRIKHFIVNESNSGSTFKQWQKGLELCTGEFIWIAESDDLADPNFLKETLNTFAKAVHTGIVYSSSKWIDEKGKTIHTPEHENEDDDWSGEALITTEFLLGNVIYNASSAVFRAKLLTKIDFNTISKYTYTGDWMFWVQLADGVRVERINKRLNNFRRHAQNISSKSEQNGLQFLEGMEVIKFILKKYKVGFFKKCQVYGYWAKKILSSNIENKEKVLRKMPFELKVFYKILKSVG